MTQGNNIDKAFELSQGTGKSEEPQTDKEKVLQYVRDIANGLRDYDDDFQVNDHTVMFMEKALEALGYDVDDQDYCGISLVAELNQLHKDQQDKDASEGVREIPGINDCHEGDMKLLAYALLEKAEDALCKNNFYLAGNFGFAVHRAVPIANDLKVAGVFKNIEGLSDLVKEIKKSGQNLDNQKGCSHD